MDNVDDEGENITADEPPKQESIEDKSEGETCDSPQNLAESNIKKKKFVIKTDDIEVEETNFITNEPPKQESISDKSVGETCDLPQNPAESNTKKKKFVIKTDDIAIDETDFETSYTVDFKNLKRSAEEKSDLGKQISADEKENQIERTETDLPFSVIHKQKIFQELMSKAEEKSKHLKSKILSQLSEVFKMFDMDHDGIIDEKDLKFTFTSLGETDVSDEKIRAMINESSKPIDFNTFVGMFESKHMEFDSEMDLLTAFSKWDTKSNGSLLEDSIKEDLQSWGDRFSEKETAYALEEAPLYEEDGKPTIDYVEFCENLCGLQNIRKSELYKEKYLNDSTK